MAKHDYVTENADGSRTVQLARGATVAGVKVMALTMREPTVADQLAANVGSDNAAKEIALFANLCSVAPDEVKGLTMRDYTRLQVAYTGFLD